MVLPLHGKPLLLLRTVYTIYLNSIKTLLQFYLVNYVLIDVNSLTNANENGF